MNYQETLHRSEEFLKLTQEGIDFLRPDILQHVINASQECIEAHGRQNPPEILLAVSGPDDGTIVVCPPNDQPEPFTAIFPQPDGALIHKLKFTNGGDKPVLEIFSVNEHGTRIDFINTN